MDQMDWIDVCRVLDLFVRQQGDLRKAETLP